MTDRAAGFIVALDYDLRLDDAEATLAAIRQIRGVISVEPVVGNASLAIAKQRARFELSERLYEVLKDS
jgi:hypothetical protein